MNLHQPAAAEASDATSAPGASTDVHKFGGSSLANAERLRHAATIVAGRANRVIVASAMQGVTNSLIALAGTGVGEAAASGEIDALEARHRREADRLGLADAAPLNAFLAARFAELRALVAGERSEENFDRIQGIGEMASSRMLYETLGGEAAGYAWLDAREVLVVEAGDLGCIPDWTASSARWTAWRAANPSPSVVTTGYVASLPDGRATTLGRDGSDYSAAIFAALAGASELTIWTDVDGVMSADPRHVPDAVPLTDISYEEACELAYFGAKVIHPQTMIPAMERGIPIRIRNSRRPEAAGTLISRQAESPLPVKGLSLISNLAALELVGNGLIGVPGTAERLFAALHAAGVSVSMITQGSSEHSICCLIPSKDAPRAQAATRAAFADAIAAGQVDDARINDGLSVLAAVGDAMIGKPNVAARFFGGIGKAGVSIRAIAQGASERNISVAVKSEDADRALRAAHAAFWLSPQTIAIGVVGAGNIGRTFLTQLDAVRERLSRQQNIDLRLFAVANSKGMSLSKGPMTGAQAIALLGGAGGRVTLDCAALADHLRAVDLPHAMIVDASGNDAVADCYADWLKAGIHVVTPSKHAGSGPLARYDAIGGVGGPAQWRYEATVGAGLPVMQTLRGLLETGDELLGIEGVLSGTLAWIFNSFDGSRTFSSLIREAMALGYTEPDPRDDLGGLDVARKVVILAREAGRRIELDDVTIESLVPEALRTISRDEFVERLEELDAPMQARLDAAAATGRKLRYVATLDDATAGVGLAALDPDHACANGRLTDNVIQFRTARYSGNPLVVQGPGAGPEVTAAGMMGDVLLIARELGGGR